MSKETVEEVKTVEISDVVEKAKEVAIDLTGISDTEKELGRKSGLIKDEKEEEVKEEKKVIDADDKKAFEKMEDNESNLGDFSKREQALYFKWKSDKKERQKAQAERDIGLLKTKTLSEELNKAKDEGNLTQGKLKEIEKLMSGDADNITIEAIQEILAKKNKKEDIPDDEKPITKKDILDMQKEKEEKDREVAENTKQFVKRMTDLEEYGKDNLENYNDIISLSQDVINGKVDLGEAISYKDIARRLVEKIEDKNTDEEDILNFVVSIAKLNPKYGKEESKSTAKKVSGEDIEKIVKNAAKSKANTTTGGNTRRVVNVNDITLEDASKLTTEQYMKLPPDVRTRLKKEAM